MNKTKTYFVIFGVLLLGFILSLALIAYKQLQFEAIETQRTKINLKATIANEQIKSLISAEIQREFKDYEPPKAGSAGSWSLYRFPFENSTSPIVGHFLLDAQENFSTPFYTTHKNSSPLIRKDEVQRKALHKKIKIIATSKDLSDQSIFLSPLKLAEDYDLTYFRNYDFFELRSLIMEKKNLAFFFVKPHWIIAKMHSEERKESVGFVIHAPRLLKAISLATKISTHDDIKISLISNSFIWIFPSTPTNQKPYLYSINPTPIRGLFVAFSSPLPPRSSFIVLYWILFCFITFLLFGLLYLIYKNLKNQLALAMEKQNFISAVSHELRTPLTSIRMYADMLQKNWAHSPEKREIYLGYIQKEGNRLSKMIEGILTLSTAKKDKINLPLQEHDLQEATDEIIEKWMHLAKEKGFELFWLNKSSHQAKGMIHVDSFEQIISNILDNAVKFSIGSKKK